jgi:outer membrane protein assembly factor BamE (lipoprotein component of BamABCDE complex)
MSTHCLAGIPGASRLLAAGALTLLLAACTWPQEVRGNLPETSAVAAIQPGISNKADVTRLMGSPSTIASFDNNTWYYVSRRIQRVTLQDPELLEQRVYVVSFDDKGTVTGLQTHVDDDHDVAMIPRATPAPGKELSFIEQLLGSFGKFGSLLGDKKKPDTQDQG